MHGQITFGLRTEPVAGFCDYGNELKDSHKTGTSLPMKWPFSFGRRIILGAHLGSLGTHH